MKVEMVKYTLDPELAIARAGGISHENSIDNYEEAKDLVAKFKKWGHETPFEFADATFYIEGISRTCLAQLTRHRLASFLVKSQRYVDHSQSEMVIPGSVEKWASKTKGNQDRLDIFKEQYYQFYDTLIENGVPKEDARFFLPEGTKTSLYMKANFREYMHIIELRGGDHGAQWEIKKVANKIKEQLHEIAPTLF